MGHIHHGTLFYHKKENEILSFETQIEQEITTLNETCQKNKKKYIAKLILYYLPKLGKVAE